MKVWSLALLNRQRYGLDCHQVRAVVATKSKKDAAKRFGVSMYEFNRMACDTGNEDDITTAMSEPGVVFVRPLDDYRRKNWIRVGEQA